MSNREDASNLINEKKLNDEKQRNKEKADKLKAGLFFTFVTAFGFLSGFGFSLSSTKKKDTLYYNKGAEATLHESGVELARRALARASLYSVSGFTIFCLGVWLLSGARSFEEFKQKAGSVLPRIGKSKEEQIGRTEFENLTDLLNYVIDEDRKQRQLKSDSKK
jgi:hypothetical protein